MSGRDKLEGDNFATPLRDSSHLLLPKLLRDVPCATPRDLDPGLREDRAGGEDKEEVEDSMEGVVDDLGEGVRGRDVVSDSTDGDRTIQY